MDKVMSWSELAELTHATQVAEFGWCACEDVESGSENPYDDCPLTCLRCGTINDNPEQAGCVTCMKEEM